MQPGDVRYERAGEPIHLRVLLMFVAHAQPSLTMLMRGEGVDWARGPLGPATCIEAIYSSHRDIIEVVGGNMTSYETS